MDKYPQLERCEEDINKAYKLLKACFQGGGIVMTCGNGGSAADSEHIVSELMKGFKLKRAIPDAEKARLRKLFDEDGEYIGQHLQGTLPSISLASNTSLITAVANDTAADMIFAQQVYGHGKKGDVLICFSTSGNSLNILRAIQVARSMGIGIIGFTGQNGGKMKGLCDVTILVPENSTPGIQELHIPVYHSICMMLEEEFFNSSGR
jgi:D-sedoheptulose 7-phosphate isomerase